MSETKYEELIDVHTHVVPEQFPPYVGRHLNAPWPSMMQAQPCHKHVMISGANFRTVTHQCWDCSVRVADMDRLRVTRHVLSPMPELLSYWMQPEDGAAMCRFLNDTIAGMVATAPTRFVGLGAVPLQDLPRAIDELRHCVEQLGLAGVEIGTHVGGAVVGDARWLPFFEAAADLGAAIFVHPLRPVGMDRLVGPVGLEQVLAFPGETGLAAASMITGGTLARVPKLRIAFSHGGGSFSMLLPRLRHAWAQLPQIRDSLHGDPLAAARTMYFDDLVYDAATIHRLIDRIRREPGDGGLGLPVQHHGPGPCGARRVVEAHARTTDGPARRQRETLARLDRRGAPLISSMTLTSAHAGLPCAERTIPMTTPTLRDVRLEDKYTDTRDTVLIDGNQALARALLLQHELDARAGLNTAGYVSGYRGSPVGGLDQTLWAAAKELKRSAVTFAPGVNEDLAATAIWGTQQLAVMGDANVDGVYAMWYGKGPGVDRSGDPFKHGNYSGTHPNGGVLVVAGDDHPGKSSTIAHHSQQALAVHSIPTLYPADVSEFVQLALLGWAMSRYSGCWVGFKVVNETIEQTMTSAFDIDSFNVIRPDAPLPPEGVHFRGVYAPAQEEAILRRFKLPLVQRFARANRIDRVMFGPAGARFGIVAAGKAWHDVRLALRALGIDDARAAALGVAVYKVALLWPLEPEGLSEFAQEQAGAVLRRGEERLRRGTGGVGAVQPADPPAHHRQDRWRRHGAARERPAVRGARPGAGHRRAAARERRVGRCAAVEA